jgi:hypothetical protein
MSSDLSADRQDVPSQHPALSVCRVSPSMGSTPGLGRLHGLVGDPLHALFSSTIIADLRAGHEHLVPDQAVFALSQDANGMRSDMPSDGG